MFYQRFGYRIRNNDILKDNNIKEIYCDEIHSLVEYKSYNGDEYLTHALRYLFLKQEEISIFYFTATTEHLRKLRKLDPDKFSDIKIFDYSNYPNIKKYTNKAEYKINHIGQIKGILEAHTGDFIKYGYKGLAYHKTITGQKRIAELLKEVGFTPLVLWSINTKSEHGKMDEEQLRALDELIKTEKIPAPYNFLVINSAMREGWNLNDEKVEIAIINTISETDQIQARGRIRKNIATLITRGEKVELKDNKILLDNKFIDKPLTKKDKDELCKLIGLVDSKGRLSKWPTLRDQLVKNGYVITETRKTIDNKRSYVSIIIKK